MKLPVGILREDKSTDLLREANKALDRAIDASRALYESIDIMDYTMMELDLIAHIRDAARTRLRALERLRDENPLASPAASPETNV
jgi:hypothetical protein